MKPTLDELIEEASRKPPGPAAWARIFHHYPELTHEELAQRFREGAERNKREADALREELRARQSGR
jgi:hypothetical protein